jgi:DNA-binding MarR family transcriptional regulator
MRRSQKADGATKTQETRWSLLTPHALVLLCIAKAPDTRVRDIAELVGISERGAHQIVADLVGARYVQRTRIGRRNRYAIEDKTALKQGPIKHRRVASIIALLGPEPASAANGAAKKHTNGAAAPSGPRSRTRVTKAGRRHATARTA